jgi:hypothetical protein|nr:MAG TPA: Head to tail joining protein [Caudoviricetes sp.]
MVEGKEIDKKYRSLAEEYQDLKQDRQPYLDKAKEAAKYTIPSLIADRATQKQTRSNVKIETPNQSIGADGVNNLSAKITTTMLPPNQTFFKFSMDSVTIRQQATVEGSDKSKFEQDVNKGLSIIEKNLLDYQEQSGDRVCVGEAIKHQLIAGNVFLVHDPKDGLRYYPLDRFCVKRDYCGNVLKAITEETVGFYALPKDIQDEVMVKILEKRAKKNDKSDVLLEDEELTLYTGFRRGDKHWTVCQEVEGIKLPASKGKYPLEICPFMALRYTAIDGESYGRGLIEEYIGDISYLDTLSLAIKQASLAGSKLVMLVNPNGLTKIKHLSEAKNGGFALGRIEDVQPLQANKYYDLQVAQAEADKIERRLNRIFVMKAAIQRQAERVTAEEIRVMAQDLEEALGNYYSIMCKEFQKAYVKITFHHMKKEKGKMLPDLIRDKSIKLTVTTGLEALGRSSDLNKLITFWDVMGKVAPVAVQLGGKIEPIANTIAASLNLDIDGFFYSEEERAEQAKQAQQQSLLEKTAPNLINKYGDALMQQQEQEA